MNSHGLGVVDYVTELGLDKAFELAEEISSGGEHFVCIPAIPNQNGSSSCASGR